MTRYAVGDIQGCLEPLQCLLSEVIFNAEKDELWLAGDLVNRGPNSLETLRFLKKLDDKSSGKTIKIVLGNHDLHLLAIAHDARSPKKSDTFDDILIAEDRDDLIKWLLKKPLIYTDPSGDYSMVHAGIPPIWTLQQASALAQEVHDELQSHHAANFFKHMYGNEPKQWRNDLEKSDRLRLITNYFTRMRFCNATGLLDLSNKKNTTDKTEFAPWFSFSDRKTRNINLIFGHWATLNGQANTDNIYALDTGCVWGNKMTLMNLESKQFHYCSC